MMGQSIDELLGLRNDPAVAKVMDVLAHARQAAPVHKTLESFAEMMVPDHGAGYRYDYAPWVVNQEEYIKHFKGTAFIAIGAIAKKVAQQKALVFYRRFKKSGMKRDPVPPDHPLQKLFDAVNPIHTQFDLWYQMVAWRLMTGNSYWWKARNGFDVPNELWPLPSNWVWAVPSREKFIDSYLVRGVFTAREQVIPAEDVLHIREPSINWNGGGRFYGYPVAHATATAIDLEESMLRHLYHQFRNFSPPGMHYTTDQKLTQEQFLDLMVQVRSQQRTVEQTGDPILSHSGMKVDEFRGSIREMDYSNSLQTVMQYILAMFGTPQAVVGVSKDYNRANMVGALISWCENTINPLLVHTGQHLTQNLASDFDDDLIVEFEPVSVDDVDAMRADIATAQSAGAITPNEVREVLLKRPPYDKGGDRPLISSSVAEGFIGNGDVPDAPDPNAGPPGADGLPDDEEYVDDGSDDNANDGADGDPVDEGDDSAVDDALEKADTSPSRDARAKRWLKLHGRLEKRFATKLAGCFKDQQKRVVGAIESLGGEIRRGDLEKVFNFHSSAEQIHDVATTGIKAAAGAAIDDVFARVRKHELARRVSKSSRSKGSVAVAKVSPEDYLIGIPEEARELAWQTLADSLSEPYWDQVTHTTLEGLWKTISDGLADHKSNAQIAAMISSDPSGLFSMARAMLIARTEVTTAMCAGIEGTIRATNNDPYADPMGIEWHSIDDEDTRPTHVKAGGQVILPGNDRFDIGGFPARFPGDLTLPAKERCNCRCANIEVWAEDLPEGSDQRRKLESIRATKTRLTGTNVGAGV